MKNILLSSAVIALLSTTAMAGTVVVANDNQHPVVSVGPIVTATEGLAVTAAAGFDLDAAVPSPLGNAIGRALAYNPSIALNDDDTFVINLNGASFQDGSIHLIVEEANAGGNGVAIDVNADGDKKDIVEVAQQISTDANGNPLMRIVLSDGLTAGTHMMIVENATEVENKAAGAVAALMTEAENPVIKIDAGATAVTLAVTDAQTGSGIPLSAANAPAVPLFSVRNQIAVAFGKGTSTIDVNNARTQFVEEGAANDIESSINDTDLDQSASTITLSNNVPPVTVPLTSPIEDIITDAKLKTLTLTLTDTAGFESIDIAHKAANFNNDNASWNAIGNGQNISFEVVAGDVLAKLNGSAQIPNAGSSLTEDIILDVDGSVLKTRTVGITAALDFTDSLLTSVSAEEPNFITWGINGYQATVHDIKLTAGTWNTSMTVYNNHPTLTGEVEVTAVDAATGLELGTAQMKDILPNTRRAIAASTIEKLIPATAGKTYRADITTTIPTMNGDCNAWQRFRDAFRMVPVSDNNPKNDANNDI